MFIVLVFANKNQYLGADDRLVGGKRSARKFDRRDDAIHAGSAIAEQLQCQWKILEFRNGDWR